MTNVGKFNCYYEYVYKKLFYFVFLFLVVLGLGTTWAVAETDNEKSDKDVGSAWSYNYGADDSVMCFESTLAGNEVKSFDNNKYVSKYSVTGNNEVSINVHSNNINKINNGSNLIISGDKITEDTYEKGASKFFKCIDKGLIVTGNFDADDYAPCSAGFNYDLYKNKLNYISFDSNARLHLFRVGNGGEACQLSKVWGNKNIGGVSGTCEMQAGSVCGCKKYKQLYGKDTEECEEWNSCYQANSNCYNGENHICNSGINAVPRYKIDGYYCDNYGNVYGGSNCEYGKDPGDNNAKYAHFYVFEKNNELGIESNLSSVSGAPRNCRLDKEKKVYLQSCNSISGKKNALYDSVKETNLDEYMQKLSGNTASDINCLVLDSDMSYCSDINGNNTLKYVNGLEYINGKPNCFLKSCADLTGQELMLIAGKTGKFCSEYRYLANSNGFKYFPKNELIKQNGSTQVYCSDLDSEGKLIFKFGQNKNKDNCYLKRCIALTPKERRVVIEANIKNVEKKVARLDYEFRILRGIPEKTVDENNNITGVNRNNLAKANIPEWAQYPKNMYQFNQKNNNQYVNQTYFERIKFKDSNEHIKDGLSKYCEDEVFFINGKVDKFDDLLLNVVSYSDNSAFIDYSNYGISFERLFHNDGNGKNGVYSLESTNNNNFLFKTSINPIFNSNISDSFVCSTVITKNEGGTGDSEFDKNLLFPNCNVAYDTKEYDTTYGKISITEIPKGKDYTNIVNNIDNILLYLNGEILDLKATEDGKERCVNTQVVINDDADPASCGTENAEEMLSDYITDYVLGRPATAPKCGIINEQQTVKKCAKYSNVLEKYNITDNFSYLNSIVDSRKCSTINIDAYSNECTVRDTYSDCASNDENCPEGTNNEDLYKTYYNEYDIDLIERYLVNKNNYNNSKYFDLGDISYFDCGLYKLFDFDNGNESDNYCDSNGICYNNFTIEGNESKHFYELITKIKNICDSKFSPMSTPENSIIDPSDIESYKYYKLYAPFPISLNNNIGQALSYTEAQGLVNNDEKVFGCYRVNDGSNVNFCMIPKEESMYIGSYVTLNGTNSDFNNSVKSITKPAYAYTQILACMRYPNTIYNDSACGQREGVNYKDYCIVLDSNYITNSGEDDESVTKGQLNYYENSVQVTGSGFYGRSKISEVSIDGTRGAWTGFYGKGPQEPNINFFRTDRYGRDVYVFYDFLTNYKCTTANTNGGYHYDKYAGLVVTAECFGLAILAVPLGALIGFASGVLLWFIPGNPVLGAITGGVAAFIAAFAACEYARLANGEANIYFTNNMYNMKDYYESDGKGFYSNLNVTDNNNTMYNYYRRSDNLINDLEYKIAGANKDYSSNYGDENVFGGKILEKCLGVGLNEFVKRKEVCGFGGNKGKEIGDDGVEGNNKCRYNGNDLVSGSGPGTFQYVIRNFNQDKCRWVKDDGSTCEKGTENCNTQDCIINSEQEDKDTQCFKDPKNCLTEEQKLCLEEHGIHFFSNAQQLTEINTLGVLRPYIDGFYTKATYGALDSDNYKNGIITIGLSEFAKHARGNSANYQINDRNCLLDEYGSPIGDINKCRGYYYKNNAGSKVFVKESQSIKIGLQTSPQLFFTLATQYNTPDLFSPVIQLLKFEGAGNRISFSTDDSDPETKLFFTYAGQNIELDLFNPRLLYKYDFPSEDSNFKNTYLSTRCDNNNTGNNEYKCGTVIAEIEIGDNKSPVYEMTYVSNRNSLYEQKFYFMLEKTLSLDPFGIEVPMVCMHSLDKLSTGSIQCSDGSYDCCDAVRNIAGGSECFMIKDSNIFCYDRKYIDIDNIVMKPTQDFYYGNSYINVSIKSDREKNGLINETEASEYGYEYIKNEINIPAEFIKSEYRFCKINGDGDYKIDLNGKNFVQNFVLKFERNICAEVENEYYKSLHDRFIEQNANATDYSKLERLNEYISNVENVIIPDCNLQNGSPYYGFDAKRKYRLKRNYGAYGGFNEVCVANAYAERIKRGEDSLPDNVLAYTNDGSIDGKCVLDAVSRSKKECLISNIVYVPCDEFKTVPYCENNKNNVKEVIDSVTGKNINIVSIDCVEFLNTAKQLINNDDKSQTLSFEYLVKMKACYKGGYNSYKNIYTDKNRYIVDGIERKAVDDYSCTCMYYSSSKDSEVQYFNSFFNNKSKGYNFVEFRKPTNRELSLCVDLVINPRCEAVEYRVTEGSYTNIDVNDIVPEVDPNIYNESKGEESNEHYQEVICYPNMSCFDSEYFGSENFNYNYSQHFWRTKEKLFGVLPSSFFGSLGHAEFKSTLYCDNNKLSHLCVNYGVNNDVINKIYGSCNGYWTDTPGYGYENSGPIFAECKPVKCNGKNDSRCKDRYYGIDDNDYAIDESGEYVYEYELSEGSDKCQRFRCPGLFVASSSVSGDSLVTDAMNFSIETNMNSDANNPNNNNNSFIMQEKDAHDRSFLNETYFFKPTHIIDYDEDNIDRRGRISGFAVWVNENDENEIIDKGTFESNDFVQLVTAEQCLVGYAPAGTNQNREKYLDGVINYDSDYKTLSNLVDYENNLYYASNDINIVNGQILKNHSNYLTLLKKQLNYFNNSSNIINNNRLPQRYCSQRGMWLDTRDIYSNYNTDSNENILYYTDNEFLLNSLKTTYGLLPNISTKFLTARDGVYLRNENNGNKYEAGYISQEDTSRYCERLFCPDVNIQRYVLENNMDSVRYDIYGMEKTHNESDQKSDNEVFSIVQDNIMNYQSNILMNKYTTWKHTGGANWTNISAPRNDSNNLCSGNDCTGNKNMSYLFLKNAEDMSYSYSDLQNKNKLLKNVYGTCQTEYGYYERNSKFYGYGNNLFISQLQYFEEAAYHDKEYDKTEENKNMIFTSSINEEHSEKTEEEKLKIQSYTYFVNPKEVGLQNSSILEEINPENIDDKSKLPNETYKGDRPTRTCNSAGIWSGVANGCFRACEMLDMYNVQLSDEVIEKRFDTSYRYELTSPTYTDTGISPVYVRNSDVIGVKLFLTRDSNGSILDYHKVGEQINYRTIYNSIELLRKNKGLVDIEKTGTGFTYGDYVTGGAMWPRTIVNLKNIVIDNDTNCGKVVCTPISHIHDTRYKIGENENEEAIYGYRENMVHCEPVRCDKNGRPLRYIEVYGVCDSDRFNYYHVDGESVNDRIFFKTQPVQYINNDIGTEGNSISVKPVRRCYEDGVWGPVYGPTRCLLSKGCQNIYFDPIHIYYLIGKYNNKYKQLTGSNYSYNNLIDSLSDYKIELKAGNGISSDNSSNLNFVKEMIFSTQNILSEIMIAELKFSNIDDFLTQFTTNQVNLATNVGRLITMGTKTISAAIIGQFYDHEGQFLYYSEDAYKLNCNMSGGVGNNSYSWMITPVNDMDLDICKEYVAEDSNETDIKRYDCAQRADLGEMIKPLVCGNDEYVNMGLEGSNNSTVVNRLQHKLLRDTTKCNDNGEECESITNRINGEQGVEMYIKGSKLDKVYEFIEMNKEDQNDNSHATGQGYKYSSTASYTPVYYLNSSGEEMKDNVQFDNSSIKSITIGTHDYISYQGYTRCDENFFYNYNYSDNDGNKNKYKIDDYRVIYECNTYKDKNKGKIVVDVEGVDFDENNQIKNKGKMISPYECAPKFCGTKIMNGDTIIGRGDKTAHRNWSVSYIGQIARNQGKYGYSGIYSENEESYKITGKGENFPSIAGGDVSSSYSTLKCPAGYAFVIKNHKDILEKNGSKNNYADKYKFYKYTIEDGEVKETEETVNNSNKFDIFTYYSIDNNEVNKFAMNNGWISEIHLGCYEYDYNNGIVNGANDGDRSYGQLGIKGVIDDTTTFTFCKTASGEYDNGETSCTNMKIQNTFDKNFLNYSHIDNNPGYCVYMGCRFKTIATDIYGKSEKYNYQFSESDIEKINDLSGINDAEYGIIARIQFNKELKIGGLFQDYDKCANNECNLNINLCKPNEFDHYTSGKEEILDFRQYLFSGKQGTAETKYDICRDYLTGIDSYNSDYNDFFKRYENISYSKSAICLSNDDIKAFDKKVAEYVVNIKKEYIQERYKNDITVNCINKDNNLKEFYSDNTRTENGNYNGYTVYQINNVDYIKKSDSCTQDGKIETNCSGMSPAECIGDPDADGCETYCTTQTYDCLGTYILKSNVESCYNEDSNKFLDKIKTLNSIDNTLVDDVTFEEIKGMYNNISISTSNFPYFCVSTTKTDICNYDSELKEYAKLVAMKNFVDSENDFYNELINNYIDLGFGDKITTATSSDTKGCSYSFEFESGNLNVCANCYNFVKEVENETGGEDVVGQNYGSLCLKTNVNSKAQNFIFEGLSENGQVEEKDLTITKLDSFPDIYNDSIGVLINNTNTVYNNLIKGNYSSKCFSNVSLELINNYKGNNNECGNNKQFTKCMVEQVNKYCSSSGSDSIVKLYETYKSSTEESNKNLGESVSGFYTILKCNLDGKVIHLTSTKCHARCNGDSTSLAINPEGRAVFDYTIEDVSGLRHSEIYKDNIYARARCIKNAKKQTYKLKCENGSMTFSIDDYWGYNFDDYTIWHILIPETCWKRELKCRRGTDNEHTVTSGYKIGTYDGVDNTYNYCCYSNGPDGGTDMICKADGSIETTHRNWDEPAKRCTEVMSLPTKRHPLFKYKICVKPRSTT